MEEPAAVSGIRSNVRFCRVRGTDYGGGNAVIGDFCDVEKPRTDKVLW